MMRPIQFIASISTALLVTGSVGRSVEKRIDDYVARVAKGASYWRQLQTTLADPDHADKQYYSIEEYGWGWRAAPSQDHANNQYGMSKIPNSALTSLYLRDSLIDKLRLSPDLWFHINAYSPPGINPSIDKVDGRYENFLSPYNRAFLVYNINNEDAKNLHWSDYAILAWRHAVTGSNHERFAATSRDLSYIFQAGINNDDTLDILESDYRMSRNGVYYRPREDMFNLILGSKNGLGTYYMLRDYRDELGSKTIDYIYVFDAAPEEKTQGSLWILFVLKDAPRPGPRDL